MLNKGLKGVRLGLPRIQGFVMRLCMKISPLCLLLVAGCGPKNTAEPEPVSIQAPVVQMASVYPTIASLVFPVDPAIATAARSIIEAAVAVRPFVAADTGLMEDAVRVPSFTPERVAALVARLDGDITALKTLPFAELTVDEQIDVVWLIANAEQLIHELKVERRWEHRPSMWLEPAAYTLIGLATYAPNRRELQVGVAALIPGMVDEMNALVVRPTRRDVTTARDILGGIQAMLGLMDETTERDAAIAALSAYDAHLSTLTDLPEFEVIGAEAYAFRFKHGMLLPWTPQELLDVAESERVRVQAEIEALSVQIGDDLPPTAEEVAAAEALDGPGLLAIYEGLVDENLSALRAMDVVTVSPDLPAIKARPTPPPLIALTGDGGSMNPPPLFGPQMPGWWNVEHFSDDWTLERRLGVVVNASRYKETWFGPYAVHEGVPGHHLQLAQVRANPDPIRTVLWDNPTVEGWGLYAEELFWEGGGFGDTPGAKRAMLGSYRYRIRRVFYDVNVVTEAWTLQEAADWKAGEEGAAVDNDVLRTIQWPTQLIGYFAGKKQMMDLREEMRQRQGDAYSERAFNDAILEAGLIPMALIRAKMLGEPIPAP